MNNQLQNLFIEPKESEIKRSICEFLESYPNRCLFTMTPRIGKTRGAYFVSRFLLKGVSDISGIWDGKPLYIEVKTPKGRISEEQQAFLSRATFHGAIAFVARDVKDVIQNLKL